MDAVARRTGAVHGPLAAVAAAVVLLGLGAAAGLPLPAVAAGVAVVSVLASAHQRLLAWPGLLALLVVVILFIPIRRYVLPGGLPFQLEPYRVLVAGLVFVWVCGLLTDRRTRLVRTGVEGPLLLFLVAAVASVLINWSRVTALAVEADTLKALTFLVSFLLVFFMVASVVRSTAEVNAIVKLLTVGGAALAALAVLESRTGYNPFNQLSSVAPFLQENKVLETLERGRFRAIGPAEHPIALSAALVLIIPLGVYLTYVTRRVRWALLTGLIVVGVFSTVSRTGVLMLLAAGLVFFWLRRRETKLVLPLVLPLLAAVHFAVPGTLGTLRYYFFPKEGLIEQQKGFNNTGRIGELGPTLGRVASDPMGIGYGTRIVSGPRTNDAILDNQWLATALETGVIGVAAWLWFFVRVMRRLAAEARRDLGERGWLLVAVASALAAYATGMFTYDAFGFVQVTFLLFILTALAMVLLRQPPSPVRSASRSRTS